MWGINIAFNMSSRYLAKGFECCVAVQPDSEFSSPADKLNVRESSHSCSWSSTSACFPGAAERVSISPSCLQWSPVPAQAVCFCAKLVLGLPVLFCGNESTRTGNNKLSYWIFYPGSTGWPGKRCCWTTCWILLPHLKDCCSSNRLELLTSVSPTCSQDSLKNYR